MPETNLLSVGERVNVDGRDGVFFVLAVDEVTRTVTLLPHTQGPILNHISMDTVTPYAKPA